MVAGRAAGIPELTFWSVPLPDRSPPTVTLCSVAVWLAGPLLRPPASFLAIAFTGQCLFDAELLAWLQVEGVPFDFSDDVLLYDLSLEAAERVLNRLAVLESYLSQTAPLSRPEFSAGIKRPLPRAEGPVPASEPSRLVPAFPSVPCRA